MFCVDKVENSGLKFFGSDCEYTGWGEAVIEVGRAEWGKRRVGKVPV
jgi:hypothetical protein